MSTQHTPGPLTWRMGAHIPEVKGPLGIGVCYCPVAIIAENKESYQIRMDEATANARLFAAAPDLLESLKKCAAVIGAPQKGHWATDDEVNDAYDSAVAAIAKAKGGDQ